MNDDLKFPATRGSKRKKASTEEPAASSASFDTISADDDGAPFAQQSAQDLATAMLSWLPDGATLEYGGSKKLFKSFDRVRAELQKRSNSMASEAIATGETRDVLLSDITVPANVMMSILEFLPRPQAVNSASLVSKSWLALVRAPQFWEVLDHSAGLLDASSTVKNMTDLLELLAMKQFTGLKILNPPHSVKTRKKAFEQIAKRCPLLKEINAGGKVWPHMKLDDTTLVSLPALFPSLTSIRFNMHKLTGTGVVDFCGLMGERLVSLCIYEGYTRLAKLTDENLKSVSERCPNLERFGFEFDLYGLSQTVFSEKGLVDLLKGCSKLKFLYLNGCRNGLAAMFDYIVNRDCCLEHLFVVNCPELFQNKGVRAELAEKVPSFEVITSDEYCARRKQLVELGQAPDKVVGW